MTSSDEFDWLRIGQVSVLLRPGCRGTIVVIPGAMADAEGWREFAMALPTRMSVAVVNRQGRSPSEDLPTGATVSDEVEDVRRILARLAAPFTLVGWSYGGLLALEAARGRSDVASIVLYEPVCAPFAPWSVAPIANAVARGDLDHATELVLTQVGGVPPAEVAHLRTGQGWEELMQLARPAAVELAALNSHQANFTAYAGLGSPITIIIGEMNLGREPYGVTATRFTDRLPTAKMVVLPCQGHLAHVHDPRRLAEFVAHVIPPG